MRSKTLLPMSLALLAAQPVVAMQFELAGTADSGMEIVASGPIVRGDLDRLRAVVETVPSHTPILGIRIASPGGNVAEAELLASAIRSARLPITVGAGSDCASSCFLIFAAALEKRVSPSARVGVHSASINGRDTEMAMAVTTEVARRAGEYGVPPDIIGKLVTTGHKQITWLSTSELLSMGTLPAR